MKQVKKKQMKKTKQNKNKIIQVLTVAPELVTVECSLTHVLQVPNTQPYHI